MNFAILQPPMKVFFLGMPMGVDTICNVGGGLNDHCVQSARKVFAVIKDTIKMYQFGRIKLQF